MTFHVARRDRDRCEDCGFCREAISCPAMGKMGVGGLFETACIDCKACYLGCPQGAIDRVEDDIPRKEVEIFVDGERFSVPERTTVKRALEEMGLRSKRFPGDVGIYTPCETGGCWACAQVIDGEVKPICVTPVRDGMSVELSPPRDYVPLRRVSGYQAHPVGGVGTPISVKRSGSRFIEVAVFAHGCNLRCFQCQNFTITYDNATPPSTPKDVATILTHYRKRYGVDRMAISGGEPTLNIPWLLEFFRELRRLNPTGRIHLDTNATVLTREDVNRLVEAGLTDIGPDLKGLRAETFVKITAIENRELAERYLDNSWSVTKYVIDEHYPEDVFVGIGIPYNTYFMTLEELREIGDEIASIDSSVQVCALNYFSRFRRADMKEPSLGEMREAWKALKESGLKCVIAQTPLGYIGDGQR